jgi:cytochrome P450
MRADFSSQSYFSNPAAEIENLRRTGPVVEVRIPIVGKVWTTTTQDLADRVLKDSDTFTLRQDNGNVAGLRWWMPDILRTLANNMLSMDEPDHRRLRDIVDEAFRTSKRTRAAQIELVAENECSAIKKRDAQRHRAHLPLHTQQIDRAAPA